MIEREQTKSTPYIFIDEEKGYMHFRGESFHENVLEFYKEIIDWLQSYLQSDFKTFTFDCELRYFNSSTAKLLLNMLMILNEAASPDNTITVNWITTADNEIIIECGEDFAEEVTEIAFNQVIRIV